jgi:nucleoside-diphosphate-sugar epimerase
VRIFVAGASGVIGRALVPLLVAGGHEVAGMTRSADKVGLLRDLGAEPVQCDVYDRDALLAAVRAFGPDAVVHQLTDLPDDAARIRELAAANTRMRREGTRNLLDAAEAAGSRHLVAQSIAWDPPGDGRGAKLDLERAVLDAGGVVARYGQLYGPGTYYEDDRPDPPRVSVDEAARRTVPLIDAPSGVVEVLDPA